MDDPIGRWLLELLLLLLAALAGAAQEAFKNANESKLREMADENPRAEKLLKLMDLLNEHDDVQNVYANFEVSDALVAKMGG